MGVEDIAEKIRARVESGGFDRSVKFDTGADGVILIDGATLSTTDGPADCTIKLSLDDLESLVAGDLNPTMAFMSGKIKIEGDMTVDAALNPTVMKNYPFSRLSGPANILVMPGLQSANISAKLLRELGGATMIGPMVSGMRGPMRSSRRPMIGDSIASMIEKGSSAKPAMVALYPWI